jgi:hypothetical protein
VEGYIGSNEMRGRLSDLFMMFRTKGFMPIELPELVRDIFEIMDKCRNCTITAIDRELEELGWGLNIMDNATYELITSLVEGNVS